MFRRGSSSSSSNGVRLGLLSLVGDEEGVDAADESRVLVKVDPRYYRPTEVDLLLGDPTKAKEKIGWTATTKFEDLVKEMVQADLEMVQGKRDDEEKLVD